MTHAFEFAICSDPQYRFRGYGDLWKDLTASVSVNARHVGNHTSLKELNSLHGVDYPSQMGGTVGQLSGVIVCGDLTNGDQSFELDGRPVLDFRDQFPYRPAYARHGFKEDFLQLCKFAVYEGWGNHDAESDPVRGAVIQMIRDRNRGRKDVQRALSQNNSGAHYSWFWFPVLFVQCNLYPGKISSPAVGSFEFLQGELQRVGPGIPVIVIFHFDFDLHDVTTFWSAQEQREFLDMISPYNVIALFHGHTHQMPIRSYTVTSGTKEIPVWDAGQLCLYEYLVARISQATTEQTYSDPSVAAVPYMLEVVARKVDESGHGSWGGPAQFYWKVLFSYQGGHNVLSDKVVNCYREQWLGEFKEPKDFPPTDVLTVSRGDLINVRVSFTTHGSFYWRIMALAEPGIVAQEVGGGGLITNTGSVGTSSEAFFVAQQAGEVQFYVTTDQGDLGSIDGNICFYSVVAEVVDSGLLPPA